MSKVLVDRELLERVLEYIPNHGTDPTSGVERLEPEEVEIRAILAARPAEAEGAVPVVCYVRAFQDGTPFWSEDAVSEIPVFPLYSADETYSMPMVRQSDHLAALSAVTAERDRLAEELGETELRALKFIHQCNAHVDLYRELKAETDQLRAEVESLRPDAERYRWVSSGVHEAETLVSIVNCHGGYAEKVAERVDVYRDAAMVAKEA